MAILDEKDVCVRYRYKVSELYILFKDKEHKLPSERLTQIIITNDYLDNLFPIVQCKFSLESSIYYKMISEKDTVRIKIRIQKYYTKEGKTKKSLYSDYINTTFSLILDDSDEDTEEELRKLEYPKGDENELNAMANDIELYLFKAALIKATKRTINNIHKNVTVSDEIADIATQLSLKNTLLMSKADNITEYDEIIIPPLKAALALAYLDSFYGIHKTGSIVYFGLDHEYIIKYEGKCSAYKDGENTTTSIIIPKGGSTISNTVSSVLKNDDKKKYYLIADYKSLSITNQSISDSVLNGTEVQIIDSISGEITNSSTDNSVNKTTIKNNGKNKYYKNIFKTQSSSNDVVLSVGLGDIDLESLTPNKKFVFLFEDTKLAKKYKGTYILCKTEIGLIRDGADMRTTVQAVFRKA